ncbi:hypothetical protein TRICI_005797 [Trichomonascus ciferrii]|uniref:Uncharacterized protein n=1 Tax=Trichomonascus ciferrii TaxID=44093 RepID=A0A642UPR6_9ASCO|nr:hypothetical protein TRICI_005797 [Trichomonascus ciferrii]
MSAVPTQEFEPLTSTVRPNTLKIYTKAHGSKTMNLVINMEDDDQLVLSDKTKTLLQCGVENETELSVFNWNDYVEYKKNPEEKW